MNGPALDTSQRRRLARRRSIINGLISALATVLVFGLVAWLVTSSPGWSQVRERFFEQAPARGDRNAQNSWPTVLKGLSLSVTIFCVAEVFILLLGLAVAVIRSLPGPAMFPFRFLGVVFTDVFRGVPTLLIIFLLGFGVPALRLRGVPNSPVLWGTVALILVGAAFNAEIFRAGIDSIHPSQMAAARSLGLTRLQALRYVIVPQAVQRMIAPLLSSFVSLQKETVLISVLGPQELMRRAQNDAGRYFNYTPYVIAALIFLAMTVPLARLTDWLIRRQLQAQWGSK